ncbi:MAG: hypothetical protein H6558_18365 [Lewinellaceae bacterium]|nr:hypothetical protein [Lewinellaceae bacterium]
MTPGLFFEAFFWSKNRLPTAYLYTKVLRKEPEGSIEDYPISVVLRKDGIAFYTQTIHDSLTKDVESTDQYDWQFYGASLMLFLQLDEGSVEATSSILRSIQPLVLKRENVSKEAAFVESKPMQNEVVFQGLINPKFYEKSNAFSTVSHYSNLPCFFDGTARKEELHLPELLLDFFFDFFHTNAFFSDPRFAAIQSKLYGHPMVKPILLKAEYYYYQKVLEASGIDMAQIERLNRKALKPERSAQDWLRYLRSDNAVTVIHPDNKWFEDIESERRAVYADR